ncbi:MAG: AAA family ATPase [Clostridia bacterium]|nr:AAA family ATPase [Clostridia bacterium]
MQINVNLEYGGLIIFCGPSTTGKTGMARRILKKYKGSIVEFISDEDFPKKKQNKTKEYPFLQNASSRIQRAIETSKFTILKTTIVTEAELYSLITAIRLMGYKGKITLIMIDLDEEKHLEYLKHRRRDGKPSEKELKNQRRVFYQQIIPNEDFSKLTDRYIVKDPNDVIIKFVD